MRLPCACALVAVVVVVCPGSARADDVAPSPTMARPEPVSTDHRHQFGLSARVAFGLRGVATYDDVDYCGTRSSDTGSGFAAVCIGRAPISLDLEASYGIARKRELILELRLGLERDYGAVPGVDGPRTHFIAPGVRLFFSEAKTSKLFTQVQLVVDWTNYKDGSGQYRGTDYGFRNLNGLWFDLHHAYGFYIFVGETLTFSRWLMGDLEAGIGIQGRYP
jgi:hypothetical protein